MGVVLAALVPVFLLIVLGLALKQSLMRLETQWHGLERLVYHVLHGGAHIVERLCAGAADGRRRALASANHHPADDRRGHHDARCHRPRRNRALKLQAHRKKH